MSTKEKFILTIAAATVVLVGVVVYSNHQKEADRRLIFDDGLHISLQYLSDWKVGRFENYPDQFNLQPVNKFVPESRTNNIFISISGRCMNTQCLTEYTLDDLVKESGVHVVSTARAKNATGYKVQLPPADSGFTGYMFVKGKDFVRISTDIYEAEMDKIIPTLELLANETEVQAGTFGWKTYRNEEYGFEIKYPASWALGNTPNASINHLQLFPPKDEKGWIAGKLELFFLDHDHVDLDGFINKNPTYYTKKELIGDKTWAVGVVPENTIAAGTPIFAYIKGDLLIKAAAYELEEEGNYRSILATFKFIE